MAEHVSLDGMIQPGGPNEDSDYALLVCGSATLTSALLEQGLVDEVVLAVYPLLLGRGKRCFPDGADPRDLALVSSTATPSGVLLNTYRRVESART